MTRAPGSEVLRLCDGRRLGYAEYGDRQGLPVLFFHGTPGSRLVARIADQVAGRFGIRIVAPERPGYGLSDFQEGRTIGDWPVDVIQLADALGIRRFAVAGVSGGGPYVAACAWRIPQRLTHAGIISGVGPLDDPALAGALGRGYDAGLAVLHRTPALVGPVLALGALAIRHWPDRVFARVAALSPAADQAILAMPAVRALLIDDAREALRNGARGVAQELLLFSRPWGFPLERIAMPVRLWHGEADAQVPVPIARRLAAAIPRCHATFDPGGGHFWVFDHLEEVVSTLASAPAASRAAPDRRSPPRGNGRPRRRSRRDGRRSGTAA